MTGIRFYKGKNDDTTIVIVSYFVYASEDCSESQANMAVAVFLFRSVLRALLLKVNYEWNSNTKMFYAAFYFIFYIYLHLQISILIF